MSNQTSDRVIIFDTTLRDGEQAPGCSMTLHEKLRVAAALRDLNVDVVEAGFPAASPGDFESVQVIANEIIGPTICGLARCHPDDIEKVANALKPAPIDRQRIHIFLATSEIHREHKLRMAKEEIIRRAVKGVEQARELCSQVEFSPEDASRTEPAFLADVVSAVIEAGVTTVNIPDTVGYTVPAEFANLFSYLKSNVSGIDDIVLSVHCHNDLGMAVANSLAAVMAGARQIECSINGIGERAGNCSLEEVVMALKTRADYFGVETALATSKLYPATKLVSKITGMVIPRNKAIVGENAFAHEAGIHQHGVLQNAETYEIMKPEDIGISKSSLVLGKHSGKHAFRDRVKELGFELGDDELLRVFNEFKKLGDRKKKLFDADIEALIMNTGNQQLGPWKLVNLSFASNRESSAEARVEVMHNNNVLEHQATGDGPIAAVFLALEEITGVTLTLKNFQVHSVTIGEDAQGEVTVIAEHTGESYRGHGISTDIVEAGALAYLEVINRVSQRIGFGVS